MKTHPSEPYYNLLTIILQCCKDMTKNEKKHLLSKNSYLYWSPSVPINLLRQKRDKASCCPLKCPTMSIRVYNYTCIYNIKFWRCFLFSVLSLFSCSVTRQPMHTRQIITRSTTTYRVHVINNGTESVQHQQLVVQIVKHIYRAIQKQNYCLLCKPKN